MNPPTDDKKTLALQQQQPSHPLDAPPSYVPSSPVSSSSPESLIPRTALLLSSSGVRLVGGTTQMLGTEPMSVTRGGARNPTGLLVGLDGKRSWNHSLGSCCDTPALALEGTFCPCLLYSSNRSRLVYLTQTGQPIEKPQKVGLFCGLYFLAPQLFAVGQIAMQCLSRFQTRERYNIRGDIVQDTLIGAFCVPCSLVQESREIGEEEQMLRAGGGVEGGAQIGAYRDEENMVQ